ncbi:MAG: hypothetical protein K1X66_07340 [Verrucomicrobiae bacterium]|nr:hypothetical protein [Verrucomicrobiae bacterium]
MAQATPSRLDQAFTKYEHSRIQPPRIQLINHVLTPVDSINITRLSHGEDLVPEHQEGFIINNNRYVADYNQQKKLSPNEIQDKLKIVGSLKKLTLGDTVVYQDNNNNYYTSQGYPLVDVRTITLQNDQYYIPDPTKKSEDFSQKNASIDDKGDIITNDFLIYKKNGDLYHPANDKNIAYTKSGQPVIPLINEYAVEVVNYWRSPDQSNHNVTVHSSIKPEKSNRAFYVRISDPALKGQDEIRVTLNISDPDDPQHPIKSVEILLKEEKNPSNPGVFRSAALILVPSETIDKKPLPWKNNSAQDQTFYAKLGSEISVSYDNIRGEKVEVSLGSVPIKQVLETQLVVFGKENFQTAIDNYERQIAALQDVLAPAGIQIKINPPILHEEEPANLPAAMLQAASDYPSNQGIRFVATSPEKQSFTGALEGVQDAPWFKEMGKSILIDSKNPAPDQAILYSNAQKVTKILIASAPGNPEQNLRRANERNDNFITENRLRNNILSSKNDPNSDDIYATAYTEAQLEIMSQSTILQNPPPQTFSPITAVKP